MKAAQKSEFGYRVSGFGRRVEKCRIGGASTRNPKPETRNPIHLLIILGLIAATATGCWDDDMADNGHFKPEEASPRFAHEQLARPLVDGVVPRGGEMVHNTVYAVTPMPTTYPSNFPFPMTRRDLVRGHERYTIYCSPCHGALGDGNGMVVQRGFPHPPSYYLDRLRKAPPGYFYNIITHGYGAMYSYDDRVAPDDRWRIAAYIKALQLSNPNDNGIAETPGAQRD